MTPALDRCSIVIVGSWNQAIFTPEWVRATLWPSSEIVMGIVYGAHGLVLQFTAGLVQILVSTSQVQFQTATLADDVLATRDEAAVKLLRKLPETPILGAGINYGFDVPAGNDALGAVFGLSDDDRIAEAGGRVASTIITRKLLFGDRQLNLILARTKAGFRLDFNHHHGATVALDAASLLEVEGPKLKANSIDVATRLYGVRLDQ